jgi:selenocysteine-specific elongation factor
LAHDAGVTVLAATAEAEARLRLLDADAIAPGESAWAQVVLETPIAVLPGDHCVVRTPNETAAGGVVVAVNARRHRRNSAAVLEQLERLRAGSPTERLMYVLADGPVARTSVPGKMGLEPAEANALVAQLTEDSAVVPLHGLLASRAWLEAAAGKVTEAIRVYLEANPLRKAAPREHVRSAGRTDATLFDAIVAYAVSMGTFEERGAGLALPGWEPRPTAAQAAQAETFLRELRAGGSSPPTERIPGEDLLAYLVERRLIENTGRGVVFDRGVYEDVVERVRAHTGSRGQITIAEVRDLLGTSRKYAQALLEHLDATKVTRRVGDAHVLRSGPEAPQ